MKQIINVKLDSQIYSKNAIVKCLYWYSSNFNVDIRLIDNYYHLTLSSLKNINDNELKSIENKLNKELIDYNLRDIVKKETTIIRELIIAKAFSNGEFDEEYKGDLMDPIGIKFL